MSPSGPPISERELATLWGTKRRESWNPFAKLATILFVSTLRRGPSIKKASTERPFAREDRTFVRFVNFFWRDAIARARAVSEGRVVDSGGRKTWFGSTQLTFEFPKALTREEALAASGDPHLRLRAIRFALDEASFRAGGSLGKAQCDLRCRPAGGQFLVDIDVQAPLIEGQGRGKMGA